MDRRAHIRHRTRRGLLLGLVLAATLSVAGAEPAGAVTTHVDCGSGDDLQAAIDGTASGDALQIEGTCTGTFVVDHDLTLKGAGAAPVLDGAGSGTVLRVLAGATVEVRGLAITGGNATDGGGISNAGTLTVKASEVTANAATNGGGVVNSGTLTVVDSQLVGNGAAFRGGGLMNVIGATSTVKNSDVSGNTTTGDGGGIRNAGSLTLKGSQVTGNTAALRGGGLANNGTAALKDTDVTGNTAGAGGGIHNTIVTTGTVVLKNSVIASNVPDNCVDTTC